MCKQAKNKIQQILNNSGKKLTIVYTLINKYRLPLQLLLINLFKLASNNKLKK